MKGQVLMRAGASGCPPMPGLRPAYSPEPEDLLSSNDMDLGYFESPQGSQSSALALFRRAGSVTRSPAPHKDGGFFLESSHELPTRLTHHNLRTRGTSSWNANEAQGKPVHLNGLTHPGTLVGMTLIGRQFSESDGTPERPQPRERSL